MPCEVIYGTIHVVPELNTDSMVQVINRIKTVKKLDRFSINEDNEPVYPIPAFVIAMDMD